MIRRPPRSTQSRSSAASDVYKRQVTRAEGTIAGGASASRQGTPRGQRTRACTEPPCARTGRSHDCPPTRRGAGRSGKAMPYARDERLWEVGQPHSTCEAAEQGRESGCGGGGGKGAGRGEHGQQDAPRTQGRNWCVTCAGSCAPGRAWPNPTLDPSQEPSAVVPHAGICAGGRPKGRSLPRLVRVVAPTRAKARRSRPAPDESPPARTRLRMWTALMVGGSPALLW